MSIVNLRELRPGARVKLINGKEAEILENPGDGMWVFGRILENGTAEGTDEDPIFAQDIAEVVDAR
jgi:hypothetical protein